MQTVAAITSPVRGLVYINGRFAGECDSDTPLIFPVSPHGVLYSELQPLDPRYIPCACALKITDGQPEPDSAGESIYVICWPGNVIEIEFSPRSAFRPESEFSAMDEIPLALIRGEASILRAAGNSIALPAGAKLPDSHVSGACEIFFGDSGQGRYMACFRRDNFEPLGAVLADRIDLDDPSHMRAFSELRDATGHLRVEEWEISADGARLASSEFQWSRGAPDWPQDHENAAIAACEAFLLGLTGEAEAFLHPRQRASGVLERVCEDAHACVSLRYAPPDARHAVGILRRETHRFGRISAAYYVAHPDGGVQGPWLIEFLDETTPNP